MKFWTNSDFLKAMLIIKAECASKAEDEFYFAGTGVVVTFKPVENSALNVGLLKVDEGAFENQKWTPQRRSNPPRATCTHTDGAVQNAAGGAVFVPLAIIELQ